jgi:hypothetical protein
MSEFVGLSIQQDWLARINESIYSLEFALEYLRRETPAPVEDTRELLSDVQGDRGRDRLP